MEGASSESTMDGVYGRSKGGDLPGEQGSRSRISLTMTTASAMEVPWRSTVLLSAATELHHVRGKHWIRGGV